MDELLEQGFKKQKLRAHSDMMWNNAVNDWALQFNDSADILVESKHKNLASHRLLEHKVNTVCDLNKSNPVNEPKQELVSAKA
jgi:hypothetical protein